ncbi:MAG: site-specific integrase, partial [Clostridiales bacterium]|nr:site-specific integrase [Clostridiales bacterium]
MSLEESLYAMLVSLKERNFSPRTILTLFRDVREFICFFNYVPVCELSPMHMQLYRLELIESHLTEQIIKKKLASISRFFEWLQNKPPRYAGAQVLKLTLTNPKIITLDEIVDLIDCCDDPKQTALIMTLLGSGLRDHELAKLKVSNVDSRGMHLLIHEDNGKINRVTILARRGLVQLRTYWKECDPKNDGGWLFPNEDKTDHISVETINQYIDKAAVLAEVPVKVTADTLRRSFAV